jgi:hypothetical protein
MLMYIAQGTGRLGNLPFFKCFKRLQKIWERNSQTAKKELASDAQAAREPMYCTVVANQKIR